MSSQLAYSAWHRSLGFSYFAMDLDYIEIRENKPVAIIESSLTTPARPNFDDVVNRFLKETGGFQFEMAYWVSLWLEVPAYLICTHPVIIEDNVFEVKEGIHILKLHTAESITLSYPEYRNFIETLPNDNKFFSEPNLPLPELLELLLEKYPSFSNYPFFNVGNRANWLKNYELRLAEIGNRTERQKPTTYTTATYPVKTETTGKRLQDYEILREKIELPYLNLNWVEWRKDNSYQKIGRPAAIIKTVLAENDLADFNQSAEQLFQTFSLTEEFNWLNTIAEKMLVPWYFTVYTVSNGKTIGNTFWVWSSVANKSRTFSKEQYEIFIKKL